MKYGRTTDRVLALSFLSLSFLGCGCETTEDNGEDEVLAYECAVLLDTDADELRGCADPDCAEQPQCQVPWVVDNDAVLGSVRVRPPDEGHPSDGSMFPGNAAEWVDLDGDDWPDTALTVGCYNPFNTTDICSGSTGEFVGQYLVSGKQLAEEQFVALESSDALAFDYHDPAEQDFWSCRGSTAILDLDGDGAQDLVMTQPQPDTGASVRLWWGDAGGLGLPRDPDLVYAGGTPCAKAVVVGDVAGDDAEDLALVNGPLPGGGIGIFVGGHRPQALTAFDTVIDIAPMYSSDLDLVERAGDFVGDTRDDLLLSFPCGGVMADLDGCEDSMTSIIAGFGGQDSWSQEISLSHAEMVYPVITSPMPHGFEATMQAGDVNGDGRRDLVFTDPYGPHFIAHGERNSVEGMGWVLPGTTAGWSTDNVPEPVYLLPSTTSLWGNQWSFASLAVADVTGDGIDDIIVADSQSPVPASAADELGYPLGDDGDAKTLFHVYRGAPGMLDDEGVIRFPDLHVITGVHPGWGGEALFPVLGYSSTRVIPDLDGDGIPEWVNQNWAYADWDEELIPDPRNVVEILSGEPLIAPLLDSP